MDGVGVGDFGGGNDIRDVQVRTAAGGRANTDRFISKANMQAFLIGGRVYSHGFDAHFPAGSDDTEGNLSSVGYEYFIEQNYRLTFKINETKSALPVPTRVRMGQPGIRAGHTLPARHHRPVP